MDAKSFLTAALIACALPLTGSGAAAASPGDLACRYLWDVDRRKPDYCGPIRRIDADKHYAEMASIEPFARERQAGVQSLAARIAEVGEAQCGEIFHRISEAKLATPLNERTFPAWLPEDKGAQAKLENCLKRLGEANRSLNEELSRAGGDPERAAQIRRRLGQVESVLGAFGGRLQTAESFKAYAEGSRIAAGGGGGSGAGAVLASAGGASARDDRPVRPPIKSGDLGIAVPPSAWEAAAAPRARPSWTRYMSRRDYSERDRRDAQAVVEGVSGRLQEYYGNNRDFVGDRMRGLAFAGPATNIKQSLDFWARSLGAAVGLETRPWLSITRGCADHQMQTLEAARKALPEGSNLEVKALDVGRLFQHHAVAIHPKGIDPADPKNVGKVLVLDPWIAQSPEPDDMVYDFFYWKKRFWPPTNMKIHD